MVQHHKWSMTEIEDMLPYERDIYMTMLTKWVEEENERIRQQQKHQVKMAEETEAKEQTKSIEEQEKILLDSKNTLVKQL